MVFSKLDDEILTEIFSRVPAKSVGKFKCLSKTWNTILSSPYFIKLHLSRKIHKESLILFGENNSLDIINPPFQNSTIAENLELEYNLFGIIGSCNGLVLLLSRKGEMFLVNPITLEEFKVPESTFDVQDIILMYGFGYDSSTDDYKIIVVSCTLVNHTVVSYSADLYTVRSGVWRGIDPSPYKFVLSINSFGVFVNSSIHWYRRGSHNDTTKWKTLRNTIIAFDLATEVFHEVHVPLIVFGEFKLFGHEGRLCGLAESFRDGYIDVWMMEEYGMVKSWKKLSSVDINRKPSMPKPLYFSREEGTLLVIENIVHVINVHENIVRVINVHEKTIEDMVVDGVVASFFDGRSFVGSLVSIKGMISSSD